MMVFWSAMLVFSASPQLSSLQLSSPLTPFFTSSPDSYQVLQGEKVLLSCRVTNLGDSTLIWKKDGRMISAGDIVIRKNARMKLLDQSLEISDVTEEDAGQYICNVETFGSPLDQVHSVSVLVPPSIQSVPQDGKIKVLAGSSVTIQCRARGNPTPQITWSRQNLLLPGGDETQAGPSLYVSEVSVQHAGLYVCTADNGQGRGAAAGIQLAVLYPPQVDLVLDWVKHNKQISAQIFCHVQAEPVATVRWYKDTLLLEQTDRRRMTTSSSKHILLLSKLGPEDLGNYTCHSENSLGLKKQSVEVSGRPNPANVTSKVVSMYKDKYILEWMVDSLFVIEECRILYRMARADTSDWTNIIPTMEQKDNMFTFTFPSLTPDTDYEVIIQTRNREGWANPSNIFKFKTMDEASQLFHSRQRGMFSGHSSQLQAGVGVINILVMGVGVRWYS
eukprot:TRINITY_DN12843_c0_g1_i2.p1 TRINITY_DN12843_c0_g1~~TRINITY_DN12843_c0_g1_i2.p1  ORF type:complete len:446 (-),score=143.17 TRINITY_DN12843_c0_g1_i2:65-1402(-)